MCEGYEYNVCIVYAILESCPVPDRLSLLEDSNGRRTDLHPLCSEFGDGGGEWGVLGRLQSEETQVGRSHGRPGCREAMGAEYADGRTRRAQ